MFDTVRLGWVKFIWFSRHINNKISRKIKTFVPFWAFSSFRITNHKKKKRKTFKTEFGFEYFWNLFQVEPSGRRLNQYRADIIAILLVRKTRFNNTERLFLVCHYEMLNEHLKFLCNFLVFTEPYYILLMLIKTNWCCEKKIVSHINIFKLFKSLKENESLLDLR